MNNSYFNPDNKMNRLKKIIKLFTFNGFCSPPLSNTEITTLINEGWTDDEIYGIGCDAYTGFNIQEI